VGGKLPGAGVFGWTGAVVLGASRTECLQFRAVRLQLENRVLQNEARREKQSTHCLSLQIAVVQIERGCGIRMFLANENDARTIRTVWEGFDLR
jgi:hypothetical protein